MLGNCNAIQQDGKLLVGGVDSSSNATVIRYMPDGSRDYSFVQAVRISTSSTAVSSEFYALCVQDDGKIIAGGKAADLAILVRFNTDGSLDGSFGTGGRVMPGLNTGSTGRSSIRYMGLSPDNGLLVGGTRNFDGSGPNNDFILKYDLNGVLNNSFGNNGIMALDSNAGGQLEILENSAFYNIGTTVMEGTPPLRFSRHLSNGQPDSSFDGDGIVTSTIDSMGAAGLSIKVQPDHKILVAGIVKRTHPYINSHYAADIFIARYLPSGLPDNSFGNNGIVKTSIDHTDYPRNILLQTDGKILVGGTSSQNIVPEGYYTLIRYLPNGSLDNGFGVNGIAKYSTSSFQGTCRGVQFINNRIYLSGWANDGPKTGMNTFAIFTDGVPYPRNIIGLCPPVANTTFFSGIGGSNHQWQVSTDSITFTNITDNNNYSGTTTAQLTLSNLPSSWTGYQYRCRGSNGMNNIFTIRFSNTWTGSQSSAWENPANWSCGTLPDANTAVLVNTGTLTINTNVTIRSLKIMPGATVNVNAGYTLTILH
jgi:uncharacterized delta-60 repeat protein